MTRSSRLTASHWPDRHKNLPPSVPPWNGPSHGGGRSRRTPVLPIGRPGPPELSSPHFAGKASVGAGTSASPFEDHPADQRRGRRFFQTSVRRFFFNCPESAFGLGLARPHLCL